VSGLREVVRRRVAPIDTAQLRAMEFPWAHAGEAVYLNAASTGPLPERSIRAQEQFTRKRGAPHRITFEEQFGVLAESRRLIAKLIGADERSVALAGNTSAGLNLAAWGLPLGPGDVVVVPALEFPANMYPWLAASRARGFAVDVVPARNGLIDEDALVAALDAPGVRVLSVSWVGFSTGAVVDLDRLGAECRARGILFVVDAIQGLGALRLDLGRTPVDLVACGGQKWLLSPWGTGFTWVAPSLLDRITVQPVSWMAVRDSDDFSRLLEYDLTWRDDARRFEQVTMPFQDFAGMAASLGMLDELGAEAVATHIAVRTRELLEGAAALGIPVVTPRARHAGICSVRPRDAAVVSARLDGAGVIHSVREGTIRLAPHCYTTEQEIGLALEALKA
jgi:cysteine desulfurase/selenocysteine lyase